MSLNWRTTCAIPYLRDYAAASKREAETKPIRGDEMGRKPLGRRDQKYRHIARLSDNSIAIFDGWSHWQDPLHCNPDIQFFENGEIHIFAAKGWNKGTPNEVLTEVMGVRVFTEGGKAWIKYDGGMTPLRERPPAVYSHAQQKWITTTEKATPSIFRRNEAGQLECLNPLALTTHVVSRKGAKAVRERYMAALDYIDALARLRRDDKPLWKEIAHAFPERFIGEELSSWECLRKIPEVDLTHFKREHAVALTALMRSEDLNDHYKAYLWLQRGAEDTHKLQANSDKVLAWAHRDEWFKEREAVVGEKVHDRYAWAFAE